MLLAAECADDPFALVSARETKDVSARVSECSRECATRISRCARRRSSPSVFLFPKQIRFALQGLRRSLLVATLHVQSRQFRRGEM